jgi:protein-disulfide isomerase
VASRRLKLLAVLVAVAVAVVGVAVALGSGGRRDGTGSPPPSATSDGAAPLAGAAEVDARFRGIPQQGATLGRPTAPVTLVEFADLKCPVCRAYTRSVLPTLVRRYVRGGRLKIELRLQTFVGDQTAPGDSARAARAALAAGTQGRLWQFADLFYLNQRDEAQAYVTDAFLRHLGSAIPGLDVARMMRGRADPSVADELRRASRDFDAAGFQGTPSFRVGRTGGALTPLNLDPTDQTGFTAAIDRALTGG